MTGAVDCATLCMVSAGICAASVISPRDGAAEVSAAKQGLRVNVWFGDYIEAAYPFMERDPVRAAPRAPSSLRLFTSGCACYCGRRWSMRQLISARLSPVLCSGWWRAE